MLKIIRTILIIVISVASSTATTVLLMFRYTKPIEISTAYEGTAISQQVGPEQHSAASIEAMAETLAPGQEQSVEKHASAQTQPDVPRYFDYALLSKDIETFSATVSRFNEILSREIQKLKEGASSGENTSP